MLVSGVLANTANGLPFVNRKPGDRLMKNALFWMSVLVRFVCADGINYIAAKMLKRSLVLSLQKPIWKM